MGMNETPSGERLHIAFFGRRNAGKSSMVNAVTGQSLAVVSDIKGTTTDPVSKAMELLPLGPVMIIDTPGFDDEGKLGEQRVAKTRQILNKTDIAVLVTDITEGLMECDRELISLFKKKGIPYIIVRNKSDLLAVGGTEAEGKGGTEKELHVSALMKIGINELKERIAALAGNEKDKKRIVGDLISEDDIVLLVVPIDEAAPKGRLILPQQQTIRDILDSSATAVVVKEDRVAETIAKLRVKPAMVITDSQVFGKVAGQTPEEVRLTSFSILFARYKGLLDSAIKGVRAIEGLKSGDTVLIAEGCTHHRQCNDIGSVKIPRWLKEHTGKEINIQLCSGAEFPEDLSPFSLIIHCGGCMLSPREVLYRAKCAEDQGIPITNYGVLIAYMQGILERSLSALK